MTSEDPRRKLIAEAMRSIREDEDWEALPAAVELIEELTAELSRESYTLRRAVERAEKAEATIATQAAEIERLRLRAYWLRHKAPDEAGL